LTEALSAHTEDHNPRLIHENIKIPKIVLKSGSNSRFAPSIDEAGMMEADQNFGSRY